MELTYSLTIDDFMFFNKKHLKDNSFIFKNYVFVIALIVAVLLHLNLGTTPNTYSLNGSSFSKGVTNFFLGTLLNFILCIVFILLFRLTIVQIMKKNLAKNLSIIGNRKLEFTENYKIVISTDCSTNEFDLSVIQKIVEVTTYYYIYVNKYTAIIVPKKAVQSDEFIKAISEKIKVCDKP